MAEKKKILVIDDEVDICDMLKENLEETGRFDVVVTCEPEKAVALASEAKPDMIVTDIVMPGMRDAKIIDILKTDSITSSLPIIVITGGGEMVYSEKKDKWSWMPNRPVVDERGEIIDERNPKRAAEEYEVDGYLNKPFATEVLIDVIDEVFEKWKKKKERQAEEKEAEERRQKGIG